MELITANRKVLDLAGGSHAEVARILGYTDRRSVWCWTNDLKPFPPRHCIALENAFPGQITRQELRPHDWRKEWPIAEAQNLAPELIGKPGAVATGAVNA